MVFLPKYYIKTHNTMKLAEEIGEIEDLIYQINEFDVEQQKNKFLKKEEYPSLEHIFSLPLKEAEFHPRGPVQNTNEYVYMYMLIYYYGANFLMLSFRIAVSDHHKEEAIKDYIDDQIMARKRGQTIDQILNS